MAGTEPFGQRGRGDAVRRVGGSASIRQRDWRSWQATRTLPGGTTRPSFERAATAPAAAGGRPFHRRAYTRSAAGYAPRIWVPMDAVADRGLAGSGSASWSTNHYSLSAATFAADYGIHRRRPGNDPVALRALGAERVQPSRAEERIRAQQRLRDLHLNRLLANWSSSSEYRRRARRENGHRILDGEAPPLPVRARTTSRWSAGQCRVRRLALPAAFHPTHPGRGRMPALGQAIIVGALAVAISHQTEIYPESPAAVVAVGAAGNGLVSRVRTPGCGRDPARLCHVRVLIWHVLHQQHVHLGQPVLLVQTIVRHWPSSGWAGMDVDVAPRARGHARPRVSTVPVRGNNSTLYMSPVAEWIIELSPAPGLAGRVDLDAGLVMLAKPVMKSGPGSPLTACSSR